MTRSFDVHPEAGRIGLSARAATDAVQHTDPPVPAAASARPFHTAETHLSWLVMVGDRVLKAKKPVWTEFLDLTTRQARQDVAEREVRLNRRLAPDVYLGVATLSGVDGLDEPVVVMRRMPDDRRLALLAQRGDDLRPQMVDLSRLLARFHQSAAAAPEVATTSAALRRWRENSEQLREHGTTFLPREQVDRVQALAERYLGGVAPLFDQRRRAGRFRDGHGDLLADDIFCLDDGPRVLDCLEFDDDLRVGDVLADVAFLAMDLEHLGRPDLATLLLTEHRRLLRDDWPPSLADHWTAYRAQVRAKVTCLRAAQGDQDAPEQARQLLSLAERRLIAGRARLLLVGGTPGTGKSTLAAAVSASTGWPVLRSDVLRKELAAADRAAGSQPTGLYSPEMSRRVLHELVRQAADLVSGGHSVILDATWASEPWRQEATNLANRTGAELVAVQTVVSDEVADERLRRRGAEGRDVSDATPQVAAALRLRFSSWPQALQLDATAPVELLVTQVLQILAADVRSP